ncbi:MAG TPA: hypothetical protein VE175_06750, partial [Woeseiaceae bacterium]|nr:hypothetical protein [Woeseiaceae bacterium]
MRLDGEPVAIEGRAVGELADALGGELLLRGQGGYDGARRIWNGMHDRYPALIVRAKSASDVANAVIDAMLEAFTPGRGVFINSFATGGAIADVAETSTAWPHRNALSMVATVAFWPDQTLDDARISATREL